MGRQPKSNTYTFYDLWAMNLLGVFHPVICIWNTYLLNRAYIIIVFSLQNWNTIIWDIRIVCKTLPPNQDSINQTLLVNYTFVKITQDVWPHNAKLLTPFELHTNVWNNALCVRLCTRYKIRKSWKTISYHSYINIWRSVFHSGQTLLRAVLFMHPVENFTLTWQMLVAVVANMNFGIEEFPFR